VASNSAAGAYTGLVTFNATATSYAGGKAAGTTSGAVVDMTVIAI
jgi:hypothetical protein